MNRHVCRIPALAPCCCGFVYDDNAAIGIAPRDYDLTAARAGVNHKFDALSQVPQEGDHEQGFEQA